MFDPPIPGILLAICISSESPVFFFFLFLEGGGVLMILISQTGPDVKTQKPPTKY